MKTRFHSSPFEQLREFSVASLIAVTLLLAACNKSNPPVVWHGVTLESGCLADAIQCYNEVGPTVSRNILLIRYVNGGATYGHAMCVFAWPGEGKAGNVYYAFDQAHASFPLPEKVDAKDPVAVAKYMIPSEIQAWYTIPDATPIP